MLTTPAKSFPTNQYGVYNISGNVWEWCSDWFSTREKSANAVGPSNEESKVIKGGSYLCHDHIATDIELQHAVPIRQTVQQVIWDFAVH